MRETDKYQNVIIPHLLGLSSQPREQDPVPNWFGSTEVKTGSRSGDRVRESIL
jgi:hypothetical protein